MKKTMNMLPVKYACFSQSVKNSPYLKVSKLKLVDVMP